MTETFLSAGKPIRLRIAEPATPGPHPAVLLLHGAGGNVPFWFDRLAPALTSLRLTACAVHYFDRTETTRADTETILDGVHFPAWLSTVADTLSHLARRPSIDPEHIALVGVSLGAFLSLSLAAESVAAGDRRVRAVIDISGGLPAPWNTRVTPAYPPTLIVHGEADDVVPVTEAYTLRALLATHGVAHQTLLLPGEGHWFSPPAQLRILTAVAGFLQTHL